MRTSKENNVTRYTLDEIAACQRAADEKRLHEAERQREALRNWQHWLNHQLFSNHPDMSETGNKVTLKWLFTSVLAVTALPATS